MKSDKLRLEVEKILTNYYETWSKGEYNRFDPAVAEILSLIEQEKRDLVEVIKLPDYDHTKCIVKETCIGYQNAESDLENLLQTLGDK